MIKKTSLRPLPRFFDIASQDVCSRLVQEARIELLENRLDFEMFDAMDLGQTTIALRIVSHRSS